MTEPLLVVTRPRIDGLRLRGADRVRFLDGQITCHVAALASGEGVFGFFPTLKGKVESPALVLADEDCLWLAVPEGLGEAITQRLEKYALFDDVAVDSVPLRRWTLVLDTAASGTRKPDPVALAMALGLPEPGPLASSGAASGNTVSEGDRWKPGAPWRHGAIASGPLAGVRWVREPDLAGRSILSLWGDSSELAAAIEGTLCTAGVEPGSDDAWDRLRVAARHPEWDRDYSSAHFPQETGLCDATEGAGDAANASHPTISYTKGCYLGQEVIARIHYRGGVQKRLVQLESVPGPGDSIPAPPAEGSPLATAEGRPAGTLGTVVSTPGGWSALAVVHRRAQGEALLTVGTPETDALDATARARIVLSGTPGTAADASTPVADSAS